MSMICIQSQHFQALKHHGQNSETLVPSKLEIKCFVNNQFTLQYSYMQSLHCVYASTRASKSM